MSSQNKKKKGNKGKFPHTILGISSNMLPKFSAKTPAIQENNNQRIDDSTMLDTSVSSAVNSGNSSVDAPLKSEDASFGANSNVLGNTTSDEHIQTNNNQGIDDSTILDTPVSSAVSEDTSFGANSNVLSNTTSDKHIQTNNNQGIDDSTMLDTSVSSPVNSGNSSVDAPLKSEDDIDGDRYVLRSENTSFGNDSTADLRKSEDHKTSDATPSKKTIIQKFYDFIKSIFQATVALFKRAYLAISSLFSKSMFSRNTAQTTIQSDADSKKQDKEQNLSSSLCSGLLKLKQMIFSNNPLKKDQSSCQIKPD